MQIIDANWYVLKASLILLELEQDLFILEERLRNTPKPSLEFNGIMKGEINANNRTESSNTNTDKQGGGL
jgi:hypothetical protein